MILHSAKTRSSGFVLITVLLVVVLLTALLLQYNYASRTQLRSTDSYTQRLRAQNCAHAGLNIALAALKQNPDLLTNLTLRRMLQETLLYEVGYGTCNLTVTAENGKLNINFLKTSTASPDRIRIDQLLRLIDLYNQQTPDSSDLDYGLVPALIDWTDADNQVTVLPFVSRGSIGAESRYYENTSLPCKCPNRSLSILDESLFVRGLTPQTLYGSSASDNDSTAPRPLADYLTVHGDGKIDINTAPALVLQSLSERITPTLTRLIIQRRQTKPFNSIAELQNFPGFPSLPSLALQDYLTTQPRIRFFTVRACGIIGLQSVTITALIRTNSVSGNVDIILYKET